ncbi:Tryptophan 2,3-dioxygenase (vermilion) [Streptosporangium canum]|uniref:Tryptophan 2,3-dioxygenase (Vermilion) n=1 Tax=Streptosporangium canum TaxID=324952 RepID=A0A1I3N0D6_9ACTN|nr:hypothetical protein [Streptosporangium canum]SFJ02470.1 Tryptophan 2,3-dioxygenase (vermilion) [Streptosporangium canum]
MSQQPHPTMLDAVPAAELVRRWRTVSADPGMFPYDAVVDAYHEVGKHFTGAELLEELNRVQAAARPRHEILDPFLDAALDKFDDRYDYVTYLALDLLGLPDPVPVLDGVPAEPQQELCRWLFAGLMADALAFEEAARDDKHTILPGLRPGWGLADKRLRHLRRAIRPVLGELGIADGPDLAAAVARRSPVDGRRLRCSMLPVYTHHDEWMFIRVLQCFETVFQWVSLSLAAAIAAIRAGDAPGGVTHLLAAVGALNAAAPAFSVLATLQPVAFQEFRRYTEGASAIQSRSYKVMEALCRRPDAERIDSAAFTLVPPVRERILTTYPSLLEALQACEDRLAGPERARIDAAMQTFADRLIRWRQTHYRLARRMLGDRTGTGYTEGVPYLDRVRTIPVFAPPTP